MKIFIFPYSHKKLTRHYNQNVGKSIQWLHCLCPGIASDSTLTRRGHEEITGSGLSYSDRGSFSTFDQDNDDYPNVNCAVSNHGAWWYKQNSAVNLNGEWGTKNPRGMRWYNGRVHRYATFTEMKIRRV